MSQNPYLENDFSENYDKYLRLPVIRDIRRQEAQVLQQFYASNLTKSDSVLEIGAGNGYYTLDIARLVSTVTALDPAAEMIAQLQTKAQSAGLENIKFMQADFFEFETQLKYDHVVAVGVLDYVGDWKEFLDKCLRLANKSVIVSAPQKGLWSSLYRLGGWFGNTAIHNYSIQDFKDYLKDYQIEFAEAGLKTVFTKGLTMILNIQKARQKGLYENQ